MVSVTTPECRQERRWPLATATLLAGLVFGSAAGLAVATTLDIYPAPAGIDASDDYTLEVDGRPVFCHADQRLNTDRPASLFGMKVSSQAFAIFAFEGKVKVKVTIRAEAIDKLDQLIIRPLDRGVKYKLSGRTVEFELDRPGDITIDPLGTGLCVLHLFINAPEKNAPKRGDTNVVFYGPGVHEIEELVLKSGQTLYLAGGAVLRPAPTRLTSKTGVRHYTGRVYTRAVTPIQIAGSNVTIRGQGIILGDQALPRKLRYGLLSGANQRNFRLQGVVFVNVSGWTILLYNFRDSLLDGVRVLGYFTNTDGICLHSCENVVVANGFIHNGDDGYEIKGKGRDIVFRDSQVWCDAGAAMGVTHEVSGLVTDCAWERITILHYTYRYNPHEGITQRGAIFVHPVEGGTVSNLRFADITIESCSSTRPLIIVYNVKKPNASTSFFPDKPSSAINGIVFRNIRALAAAEPKLLVQDETDSGLIHHLSFEKIVFNGEPLVPGDPRLTVVGKVEALNVKP
jgi:hypothetical protein